MSVKSVATVALTALLTGCAVGPNYKRPAVTAPEMVRGASAADAVSLADRPWWEVFGDDALKALIDEALRGNFDIREAAWRVEEFRARAGVARSDLYPQIQYQGQWSRSRQSEFVQPGSTPLNFHNVNLGLSWEIDLWGRIRRLSEAALAEYLSTEDARRGVLLSKVAEVARAYFSLRELDARLEIARRTTDAFRETLDLFSRQLTGGIASQLEVSRAEGAMRNAAATVPDLERQIVAQENLICFLLGRNPGPIPRGASLTEQALAPEVPAGLPSALLERRPDVRETEQLLLAANANVGAAMASFFPTISLTGAAGGVSPDVSTLFPAGKTWSIAAGLTGPLFEGMRLKNQYDANVALFEQAKVRYESAVTNAFGEISTALVAYQKLAVTEQDLAKAVAAYRESVRVANIRYVAGLSSYVEVLDAEQLLFPAENALAQARLLRLDTFVDLYKALGGGWNIADPAWSRQAPSAAAN
ncbi:MAG TPA: efflux transporter outer membrane subunit [Thermoanaerobaculia bacterium]|nr:efflux transporter outer membrane subunit [Thermoanaerobaculia bacterium]